MDGTTSPAGPSPQRMVWITFFVLLGVGLAVTLRILAPFAAVILMSLVAVGILWRPYLRLVEALRGHRRAAALLVCLGLIVAVMVPMVVTVQAVSREALGFYEMTTVQLTQGNVEEILAQHQDEIDRVNRLLTPLGLEITDEDLYRWVGSIGVRVGAFFYKQGVSLAKGLVRLGFAFIFWFLIIYFLLVDGERLRAWFREIVPLPGSEQDRLVRRFNDMAGSLLIGNGTAGIIQGLAGGLIFAVLGIPGPVLWGVVMGILAFIPVIGISFVFVPVSLGLLLAGDTQRALLVFIPLAVVSGLVEYLLKPGLVGHRMQMHVALVFLSLVGGLDAFGAVGLIIGPLLMTAFLTLVSIYRDHYRPLLLERPSGVFPRVEPPKG